MAKMRDNKKSVVEAIFKQVGRKYTPEMVEIYRNEPPNKLIYAVYDGDTIILCWAYRDGSFDVKETYY